MEQQPLEEAAVICGRPGFFFMCDLPTRGLPAVTRSGLFLQRRAANTSRCSQFLVWSQDDVSRCIILPLLLLLRCGSARFGASPRRLCCFGSTAVPPVFQRVCATTTHNNTTPGAASVVLNSYRQRQTRPRGCYLAPPPLSSANHGRLDAGRDTGFLLRINLSNQNLNADYFGLIAD